LEDAAIVVGARRACRGGPAGTFVKAGGADPDCDPFDGIGGTTDGGYLKSQVCAGLSFAGP
jgi:hypothetical protein